MTLLGFPTILLDKLGNLPKETRIHSHVRRLLVGLVAVAAVGPTACGEGSAASSKEPVPFRLAHFPNLTHAPAIFGLERGMLADALGTRVKLDVRTFNAGPEAVEALFAGAIDATYIGPNPAINAFQKSAGEAVRVVAGATSGGAAFVVRPGIEKAEDLRGQKIATPQLGNTQDVALRAWLRARGLRSDQQGGGDVSIVPQENAQTLETFRGGQIDGAWVPEPWASRLVIEAGGKVLVDEAALWPKGRYITTLLLVRTEYLRKHPDVVKRLLAGHVETLDGLNADPAAARRTVNASIEKLSGKALDDKILETAWKNLTFTYDPLVATLEQSAVAAKKVGFLKTEDIEGIADVLLLNEVLAEADKDLVEQ